MAETFQVVNVADPTNPRQVTAPTPDLPTTLRTMHTLRSWGQPCEVLRTSDGKTYRRRLLPGRNGNTFDYPAE